MAKKAMITVADPVAERVSVIGRVLARAKVPESRYAMDPRTGLTVDFTQRVAGDGERLAAKDLGEWADDRTLACFGGRTGLRPAEQAALEVLDSMRAGDPDGVRSAVRAAGHRLDEWQQHFLLYPLLEQWRSLAPGFALDVALAAAGEARRLGWDQRPKRRQPRMVQPDLDGPPGDRLAPRTEQLVGRR